MKVRRPTKAECILAGLSMVLAVILAISYLLLGSQTSEQEVGATIAAAVRATSAAPAFILTSDLSEPLQFGLQERIEAGTSALTVLRVEKWARLSPGTAPKPGNIYVVAELLIEPVGLGGTYYTAMDFGLQDSAGHTYPATMAPPPCLGKGGLLIGEDARGFVAFEVPSDAGGFVLSYTRWSQPCRVSRYFDLGM